jgi:hypothetical protein
MKVYTIYLSTNTANNKKYVGFDSSWPRRQQSHKNEALNPKSHTYNTPFHQSIRKHGWESFQWEAIYQGWDKLHTLRIMEEHFITEHQTHVKNGGYNLTVGGEGQKQRPMSKLTKQKKSRALKGKPTKQSRLISTPHGIFPGVGTAVCKLGLHRRTIVSRIESNSFNDWFYLDQLSSSSCAPQIVEKGRSQSIATPYGTFKSIAECHRKTGISKSTIQTRLYSPLQTEWQWENESVRESSVPIVTPYGKFDSVTEASRFLNISKSTIFARLKSKNNTQWYRD